MPLRLSRRDILAAGIGVASSAAAGGLIHAAAAAASPLRLTAGTRTLDVNGKAASVFGLTGPNGKPGLTLSPGERFDVSLVNETKGPTIIHWHGQLPPWRQDGFPWPETPRVAAGAAQSYDYAPISGTFWMHSHHRMQEQSLMTAPLIVHTAADQRADRQEIVLLLHDFSFRSPEEILAGLTKTSSGQAMASSSGMKMDGNGQRNGRHEDERHEDGGMAMGGMSIGGMAIGGTSMGAGAAPDLNDVSYDAFLANDRTLVDPRSSACLLLGKSGCASSTARRQASFGSISGRCKGRSSPSTGMMSCRSRCAAYRSRWRNAWIFCST